MDKIPIATAKAPKAIGPYSQAIRAGSMVYTAGQIPIDPVTGELVACSVESQARQVLENLKAVLEAAGTDFDHVVKTTVFLQDLDDFTAINKVYGDYFKAPYPARACVQVARLPKGAEVEIEAVATMPE